MNNICFTLNKMVLNIVMLLLLNIHVDKYIILFIQFSTAEDRKIIKRVIMKISPSKLKFICI